MRRILLAGLALAAGGAAARAQLASSPGFVLLDDALDGGGGGECSTAFASFLALAPLSGAAMISPNFEASLGFLGVEDPQPTNAPVIFGVTPNLGPMGGGTAVTIAGLNFDKFGVGPSVVVSVGGAPATGVVVVSNTQIDAITPAGPSGPASVVVSSTFGSDTRPDGFLYTPAVLSTPLVSLNGLLEISNVGPTTAILFDAFVSPLPASIPFPPFGTILIDPSLVFNFVEDGTYPPPNGFHTLSVTVPNLPVLVGLSLYFQSAVLLSLTPPTIVLTNRSTTLIG
jgi:hypothetical protein